MKKFLKSLLAKYMLIILTALILIQFLYVFIALLLTGIADKIDYDEDKVINPIQIEENWHKDAKALEINEEEILQLFAKWKETYPEASMFWIDERGVLREKVDVAEEYPSQWNAVYTAKFIKNRYGGNPFTVVAFVGEEEANGFIVLEIPRVTLQNPIQNIYNQYGIVLLISIVVAILIFILISFLFFHGIRKRLLQLQEAMTVRDVDGLPLQINVKREDEIGQLEHTFNQMVLELKESKKREQEEEQLRRELIANLSHDLRTPLTKINAQTYAIEKEELSPKVVQSLKTLRASIADIDRLIENLMSYTLLMANKYKIDRKEMDVVRYVRECMATWYPVFEKEHFEIEIDLQPLQENHWMIDSIWLGRIIDNLLQNVLRHAKDGKYIGVKTESTAKYDAFVIIDRGKGMKNQSLEKGVGIGLSIVDMMVKGMDLDWDIETSDQGTTIKIKRYK